MNAFDRMNAAIIADPNMGTVITFVPSGPIGEPVTLTVVWNDDEAQMPNGVRATAWLIESDLGIMKPVKNDIVRRGNFTYRLVDPPDGIAAVRDGVAALENGGVTLYLRQISHAPDA